MPAVKVLLINMPIRENAKPNNPPIGICLLVSVLQSYGFVEVHVLDLNGMRALHPDFSIEIAKQSLESMMSENGEFDLIAMSGLITTLSWQFIISKAIRKLQKNVVIASGGGLATELGNVLFNWIPELDFVAKGEGDETIFQMACDAAIMTQSKHITQMTYFCDTPKEIDDLPFPNFDLLPNEILESYISAPVWGSDANNSSSAPVKMKRSLSMISSRGCPHDCNFCYRGMQGQRNYRAKSHHVVVDEMRDLWNKYNLDFVGIVDDNCMVSRKRLHEMAEMIPGVVMWGTHGRLDNAADIGNGSFRVDDMARSGCKYIGFGAESASMKVLKRMNKGNGILHHGTVKINGYKFPASMAEGIRRTHHSGIHGNCTWIMGYPGETLEDLKTSVAFMKWQEELYSTGLVNKNMFVATAYPGTNLFCEPIVRDKLSAIYGIKYIETNGKFTPIYDEAMKRYVMELGDASKLLHNGQPLNYSDMPDDVFCEAYKHVADGNTEKILDM